MATVAGAVGRARNFLPDSWLRRRRADIAPALAEFPLRKASAIVESILPAVADRLGHHTVPERSVDLPALARLAYDDDAKRLHREVETMLARGMGVDALFVTVLAPVARELGRMWEDDSCDFVDVTMGLWRLQEIVRDLSGRTASRRRNGGRRALFAPFPGDQHNFGTIMIEDVFRRDGWDTDLLLRPQRAELIAVAASAPFDLIGLTVSCSDNIGALPALVRGLRSVTGNRGICIMLGGHAVSCDPGLVARVGADCTAPCATTALAVAARFISRNACREAFTA